MLALTRLHALAVVATCGGCIAFIGFDDAGGTTGSGGKSSGAGGQATASSASGTATQSATSVAVASGGVGATSSASGGCGNCVDMCVGSTVHGQQCMSGKCMPAGDLKCAPYGCDSSARPTCVTTCAADPSCADLAHCYSGVCCSSCALWLTGTVASTTVCVQSAGLVGGVTTLCPTCAPDPGGPTCQNCISNHGAMTTALKDCAADK